MTRLWWSHVDLNIQTETYFYLTQDLAAHLIPIITLYHVKAFQKFVASTYSGLQIAAVSLLARLCLAATTATVYFVKANIGQKRTRRVPVRRGDFVKYREQRGIKDALSFAKRRTACYDVAHHFVQSASWGKKASLHNQPGFKLC